MTGKDIARRSESRDVGLSDVFDRWLLDRWMPEGGTVFCPVDIEETATDFHLTAELPGLKREDIHITLENNVLSISGEKSYERKEGGPNEGYRSVERRYGRFSRAFTLPATIKASEIRADFKDGVLELTVPKSPEAQPRKIEIAAGPPKK